MASWQEITIAYLVATIAVAITALVPSRTMDATRSDWYYCIRPRITPPSIVFPIVWTILYITIIIALAQTILIPYSPRKIALFVLYTVNLILNVWWSFTYFGWRNIKGALAIIFFLWATIVAIMVLSFLTDELKPIAFLLAPYLLWVSFATVLNWFSTENAEKCKKDITN